MPDSAPRLPELTQTLLDPATLAALFRDLATCTEVLAVVPRTPAQAMVAPVAVDLAVAHSGLASGHFRSVQIRYRYSAKEWCDTLLATPAGVRLVRVCTDEARGA